MDIAKLVNLVLHKKYILIKLLILKAILADLQ